MCLVVSCLILVMFIHSIKQVKTPEAGWTAHWKHRHQHEHQHNQDYNIQYVAIMPFLEMWGNLKGELAWNGSLCDRVIKSIHCDWSTKVLYLKMQTDPMYFFDPHFLMSTVSMKKIIIWKISCSRLVFSSFRLIFSYMTIETDDVWHVQHVLGDVWSTIMCHGTSPNQIYSPHSFSMHLNKRYQHT